MAVDRAKEPAQLDPARDRPDIAALLEAFDNNRNLLTRVIDVFLSDLPGKVHTLRAAAASGDTENIFKAAHTIRGSSGMFTQGTLYQAARSLERDARSGAVENAAARCGEIEQELNRLAASLEAILVELRKSRS